MELSVRLAQTSDSCLINAGQEFTSRLSVGMKQHGGLGWSSAPVSGTSSPLIHTLSLSTRVGDTSRELPRGRGQT